MYVCSELSACVDIVVDVVLATSQLPVGSSGLRMSFGRYLQAINLAKPFESPESDVMLMFN